MFILAQRVIRLGVCLGLGLLLMTACTGFAPHRTDVNAICQLAPDGKHTSPGCEQASTETSSHFELAVVELTDQGWLHSRDQLKRALALTQPRASDTGSVQVVLFVHGWQHSGAYSDENVRKFREAILPRFARSGLQRGLRTVGIYVGWRGESIALPALTNITFYDRKATAEHVSRGSIRELISQLRARQDGSTGVPRAHVTLIGHSFGGLIVYNAIAESLLDTLVRTAPAAAAKPVVDLALVLNPAFEASRFEPLFQVAMARPTPDAPGRPIFVSVTSSDDSATATAFPLGRKINSVFDHEGWVEDDQCPDPDPPPPAPPRRSWDECNGYERGLRLEKMTNTNTVGHLPRYATHELTLAADQRVECRALAMSVRPDGVAPVNWPSAPQPRNRFPLWTMRTGAEVIRGHSGIYQPALWDFLVRLANPLEPADALCR